MTTIISAEDAEKLARPNVARAWFGHFDFPDGMQYLHNGVGRVTIGSRTYRGVTDPVAGRLVAVSDIDEPQFGQAASVTITLAGVNGAFLKSLYDIRRSIEGRSAEIFFAVFDGETQELLTALIPIFPRGKMSAPKMQWSGISGRLVTLTIESIWQAKNFPPGGRWNPADQRRRYPGDKGLDFVGQEFTELRQ